MLDIIFQCFIDNKDSTSDEYTWNAFAMQKASFKNTLSH